MNTETRGATPILETLALAVLVAVATFLRLRHFGDLGFWIDEDLTWIATTGILEHGVPLMPSGEFYSRSPVYSYLISGVRAVFGTSESLLRAPSLIFSLATLLLVHRFARDLARTSVGDGWARVAGVVAAGILAFSPWEFYYARMARMYALFGLIFTLVGYLIYRRVLSRSPGVPAWLPMLVGGLSVFVHQLGAATAILFLAPQFLARKFRPSLWWSIGGVLVAGLALNLLGRFRAGDTGAEFIPREHRGGSFELPALPPLDLNFSEVLLQSVMSQSVAVGVGALVLLAAVSTAVIFALWRAGVGWIGLLGSVAFAGAVAVNQALVAVILATIVILWTSHSQNDVRRRGLLFAGWLAAGIVLILVAVKVGIPQQDMLERRFLRLFVTMPTPYYRLLFQQFPLMFAAIVVGSALALYHSFAKDSDQGLRFAVLGLFGPLLLMGFFVAPYTGFRYNYYLHPWLCVLFAVYATMAATWVSKRWIQRAPAARESVAGMLTGPGRAAAVVLIALSLVFLCETFDPRQTWIAASRGYGYARELSLQDLNASFYYDFKGCAEFVRPRLQENDLVLSSNAPELIPYEVPSDYQLYTLKGLHGMRGDEVVDWYLGIPLVLDLPTLKSILDDRGSRTVWIIYTHEDPEGPAVNIAPEVLEYLDNELADHQVHLSRDGLTRVLEIRPS